MDAYPILKAISQLISFELSLISSEPLDQKLYRNEVYLNIVEWAPGVYGAARASYHHFKKSAQRLSRRQAALLAAGLPNPKVRKAGKPGPFTRRQASRIERRARAMGVLLRCIRK